MSKSDDVMVCLWLRWFGFRGSDLAPLFERAVLVGAWLYYLEGNAAAVLQYFSNTTVFGRCPQCDAFVDDYYVENSWCLCPTCGHEFEV